jgi:hypothetical protein
MPPIEIIELAHDGTLTTTSENGGGSTSGGQGQDAAPTTPNDLTAETAPGRTPGTQEGSAPQTDAPPPDEASQAASPSEGEDADVADDAATVPYVNRRIKQLNAKRRETEKQLAEERQQNALRQAQMEARLETLTRVLAGAAPDVPASQPQPTGPPQAEQFASHEDYVLAAARYGAQQEFQARDQQTAQQRQQAQQVAFQQQLMEREQAFKQAHPDFDTVVRSGLAGKVSPVLQQALMIVPDGPAVAYTLATQPELVQRLNSLPPPLVLVELGRLSPASSQLPSPTPAVGPTHGNGAVPPAQGPGQAAAPTPAPLPEPMAPVGGGGSTAQPTFSENLSQAEYEKWRAKTSNIPYMRRS